MCKFEHFSKQKPYLEFYLCDSLLEEHTLLFMATKKIRFFGLKLQMNLIIYLYTVYTALKNSFPAAQHSREKKTSKIQ